MLHEIRSVYLKKIVYFVLSEKSLVTWMMKRGVYRVLPNKIYYSGAQNIFICMLNTCFSFWPTLLVWKAYQVPIFFSSNYNITTSKNFNLKNLSTFAKTIDKFFFFVVSVPRKKSDTSLCVQSIGHKSEPHRRQLQRNRTFQLWWLVYWSWHLLVCVYIYIIKYLSFFFNTNTLVIYHFFRVLK